MLSVVIPAHNEKENISNTVNVIRTILTQAEITFELLFIDDGSKDTTYTLIEQEHSLDIRIRGIKFSRNFGKEAAILAGLRGAKGDCVAVIDCDLQHPPECLIKMYQLWEQGYHIIEGVKASRGKESFLHKFSAGIFYRWISKAVGIDMNTSSDFKLLDRKVVDVIISMPERDTLVNPSAAFPIKYRYSVWIPNINPKTSKIAPSTVISCNGNEVKDVTLLIAYRINFQVDHFVSPNLRSKTS